MEAEPKVIVLPPDVQLEKLNLVLNPLGAQREIKNPYWDTDARQCIRCEFHYPDGRVVPAAVNKSDKHDPASVNPDWTEIMSTFTTAQIEKYTMGMKRKIAEHEKAKRDAHRQWEEESARQQIMEMKLQALDEVPEIKNSKNQSLKKRLRRAKTLIEVFAYSTMLIQDSLNQSLDSDRKISDLPTYTSPGVSGTMNIPLLEPAVSQTVQSS